MTDATILSAARAAAERFSDDSETRVGVVVLAANTFLFTAANQLPGVEARPERTKRPGKYPWIMHAEQLAVAKAARLGDSLQGAEVWIWASRPIYPCATCAALLAAAGVRRVVVSPLGANDERYYDDVAREIFDANEISVEEVTCVF